MDINELKVEKISILSLFVCGLILFIEYVFGISNIIYIIYDKPIINNFNRDLFLFLYTISIIPIIGFNSKCIFKRKKELTDDLDYLFCLSDSIFTFIFGFYLYKLFSYISFPISMNIFTVMLFQFVFFLTIGDFIEFNINKRIIKIREKLKI